ncbi:iron complex outermembrane recepter protein [Andreprevotia lacus DSM 23236]|jgi:iron complex outermembrane receptor protein|uniref:Iron complex outermembrane recepter protein n=1 Tax=Andreprevotia lacus DSM 23236 TaxID=1121001 RepID=A0A1W1XW64_9NEIS|nr:TonB-dependent receptor [Andreprevotia lacus]SMC27758.1 iron complex outermembrane recepter protein [Andreprevotia lacus DSM 23236]
MKQQQTNNVYQPPYRHRLLAAAVAWAVAWPALAAAPAAGDDGNTLDTVTVTARRRSENVQDVPAPITVLKGQDLQERHLYQVQDLQQALPSTNAAFNHARQSSLAVRGIGNNPANEGLESSVGIVIDNVFYGRPGMAVTDLLDIEQLDLLRGPQGTLFGKNTTAGVLNIGTRKPSFHNGGSVSVSLGNRGYQQYQATATGGLTDTVAVSVGTYKTHDDGWLQNLHDDRSFNGIDRSGVRAQLLYVPTEDFSLRLIGDYHDEDSTTGTLVPYGFGPVAAGKKTFVQLVSDAGATNIPRNPDDYTVNVDGPQGVRVHQGGLSAEANWQLGDYKLTSITSVRDWHFRPHNDVDFSNIAGVLDNGANADDKQFSQELRLASPKGEHFDYVLGGFYFRQQASNDVFNIYGPKADAVYLTPAGRFNNATSWTHGEATTDSYALFGQGVYHATPQLDLTAGLRLTYEQKSARTYRDAPIGGTALTQAALGRWDSGTLQDNLLAPSALLSAAYRVTPSLLAYASVSHGEKSAGYNINGVGSGPALGADSLRVDPEKANSLEIGFKSDWLDRRLFVNANLFWTRITGYQTNTYLINPATGLPVSALTNAGDVETRGVEFEVQAKPATGWSLSLNGSYNDAHYRSFTKAPCRAEVAATGATTCDLSGFALNGAPRWIFNLSGRYEWSPFDGITQYVNAGYAWRSASYGDLSDSEYSRIPAYGLLNVATGWRGKYAGHGWELSLWAKNLLDTRYYLAAGSQGIGGGLYAGSAGQPRTLGTTLKVEF